ncbi:MAG: lysophospholipid acyltransferase family protein [Alphaproteobacteria bacterium]
MDNHGLARRVLLFPYQLFAIVCFFSLTCLYGAIGFFASLFDSNGHLAHRCLAQWARVSLFATGLQVRVTGLERLSPNTAYIFMPNHASFLDILLLLALLPHNFRFIIKESFFSVPLVGAGLRKAGHIPIDRKNPWRALRSLRRAADLLKDGVSIVVFPEGTRSTDGEIQDLKTALFILPIRSRTPVVPVLIEGTFAALKRGSVLLRPLPLKVTICDPIAPDLFGVHDRRNYADEVLQALRGNTTATPRRSFGHAPIKPETQIPPRRARRLES